MWQLSQKQIEQIKDNLKKFYSETSSLKKKSSRNLHKLIKIT